MRCSTSREHVHVVTSGNMKSARALGIAPERQRLRARLTQIWGSVKQAAVLGDRVAVGHAGDEIADDAGAPALLATGRRRLASPPAWRSGSAR